jgi:hypothetical protein
LARAFGDAALITSRNPRGPLLLFLTSFMPFNNTPPQPTPLSPKLSFLFSSADNLLTALFSFRGDAPASISLYVDYLPCIRVHGALKFSKVDECFCRSAAPIFIGDLIYGRNSRFGRMASRVSGPLISILLFVWRGNAAVRRYIGSIIKTFVTPHNRPSRLYGNC